MRPRISIREYVHPSVRPVVGPSIGPSVHWSVHPLVRPICKIKWISLEVNSTISWKQMWSKNEKKIWKRKINWIAASLFTWPNLFFFLIQFGSNSTKQPNIFLMKGYGLKSPLGLCDYINNDSDFSTSIRTWIQLDGSRIKDQLLFPYARKLIWWKSVYIVSCRMSCLWSFINLSSSSS